MARPSRKRKICVEPDYLHFAPTEKGSGETITLSVDEYETIRLIDLEGLTHEYAAEQMGVARTTVTEIYEEARKKLAEVIVLGKELEIGGGNYCLCTGIGICHKTGSCKRLEKENSKGSNINANTYKENRQT